MTALKKALVAPTVPAPARMNIQLIRDQSRSGPWNMAADEWLLHEVARLQTPLLRLYTWSEPTLSLGYFQEAKSRESHPPSLGCAWVRRASGGGAILHHHEITYALGVPSSATRGFAQPLYDVVHQSLVEELCARQFPAERFSPKNRAPSSSEPFLCFARRAAGDVVLDGEKILGSAQRRSATAVLQHGSLLLERSPFAPTLPGLKDLGLTAREDALIESWLGRLGEKLAKKFETRSLADHECEQINYAACDKFGTERWAMRR